MFAATLPGVEPCVEMCQSYLVDWAYSYVWCVAVADLQTISIVIAALSIVVATIYNAITIRNANKTRQAQLYIQVFDKLRTKDFIESWIDVIYHQEYKDAGEWMRKYGPTENPDATLRLFSVGIAYQTIGMLARERLINPRLLLRENPWAVVETWEKIGPVVQEIRKAADPRFWDSFEHLANQIKKYRAEHVR